MEKADLQDRNDITLLLQNFYARATKDHVIGSKFQHLNMSEHIEVIADFWEMILFGGSNYKGDPFGKHLHLDLKDEHFEVWVGLFHQTVDEMFEGKNAEESKTRASTISNVFKHKLKFR